MQGLWFLPSVIFGAFQGFTSGNWQMMAFALLSLGMWPLALWLRSHRDFSMDGLVAFDGKDVWIGDHRLPKPEFLWRKAWHQVVWDALSTQSASLSLPDLLTAARAGGFVGRSRGSTWIGVQENQNIEFNLAEEGPHLLVIGATGTGKSELLRLLISGWLNLSEPVELTLIDFKGGATMARFANHPSVVGLATDLQTTDAMAIAKNLEQQLISRQQSLAEVAAENIESFRRQGNDLRRRIVVIDELGELIRQHPKLGLVLEQIAARGRSLGVHLVVSNQSLAGVSRGLLVNLRARVAIGDMDPIDLNQLGFRNRVNQSTVVPNWRPAKFRSGTGGERDFVFPIGF